MSLDAHEFFTQEVTNVGLLQVPVLVNPMTKTSYKYINDIRSETQLGKVMLYKKMSESSELVESLDEKKIEADHHIESKYVVVKVSNLRLVGKMKNNVHRTHPENPELEAKMMTEMTTQLNHHPNIVHVIESFNTHDHHYHWIVMEHCDIDLFDYVKNMQSRQAIPIESVLRYFRQLINAVKDLHKNGYAIMDISCENMGIISKSDCLKIFDFGLARKLIPIVSMNNVEDFDNNIDTTSDAMNISEDMTMTTINKETKIDHESLKRKQKYHDITVDKGVGKIYYLSPEVLNYGVPFDAQSADIWACGIVLIILMYSVPYWLRAETSEDVRYRSMKTIGKGVEGLSNNWGHRKTSPLLYNLWNNIFTDAVHRWTSDQIHDYLAMNSDEIINFHK